MKHLREVIVGLLIGLGGLCFAVFILAHWAERQVLTTENWVDLVAPLPKEPVVSSALGSYVAVQLFNNVPVEQKIADALPPNAAFLAGPLSDQLQTATIKLSQKVVGGDGFQTVWATANRAAVNRLVTSARNPQSISSRVNEKFNIDLGGVKSTLRERLGATASVLPSLDSENREPLLLSAGFKARQQTVRQAIRLIDFLAKVLLPITLACFVWAYALSRKRRRAVGVSLAVVIVIMLIELILIKVLREQVLGSVKNLEYTSAVSYVFDTLLGLWVNMLKNGLIVSFVAVMLWIFSGPSKLARAFRDFLHIKALKKSRPMTWWLALRSIARRYRHYVWAGISFFVLVYLAGFANLSWAVVINTVAAAIICGGILHLLAYPSMPRKTRLRAVK